MDWESLIEAVVGASVEADGGRAFRAAKARFAEATGPFEPKDPWYEARTRALMTAYAIGALAPPRPIAGEAAEEEARSPALTYLAEAPEGALSEGEAEALRALPHAQRSLYEALERREGCALVADRLGGGRFRVQDRSPATRLREGDLFDGWLLWHREGAEPGGVELLPGAIFHPPAAREPIGALLLAAGEREPEPLLDSLLRMRMRLERFVSIRAPHVYRVEALDDRAILSAAWARRAGGSEH